MQSDHQNESIIVLAIVYKTITLTTFHHRLTIHPAVINTHTHTKRARARGRGRGEGRRAMSNVQEERGRRGEHRAGEGRSARG